MSEMGAIYAQIRENQIFRQMSVAFEECLGYNGYYKMGLCTVEIIFVVAKQKSTHCMAVLGCANFSPMQTGSVMRRENRKSCFRDMNLHVGMRNIKTAFAATLCALVYLAFGRNPTFACIGAVFGMGSDMENSHLHGGNRLFGTAIGGFLGMALFRFYTIFYPEGGVHPMVLLLLFVGVVILILISQNVWPGAVQPGSVVLCILLFNTPVETYVSYSLNRILDTGVGVLIALAINYVLSKERIEKWCDMYQMRKAVR